MLIQRRATPSMKERVKCHVMRCVWSCHVVKGGLVLRTVGGNQILEAALGIQFACLIRRKHLSMSQVRASELPKHLYKDITGQEEWRCDDEIDK